MNKEKNNDMSGNVFFQEKLAKHTPFLPSLPPQTKLFPEFPLPKTCNEERFFLFFFFFF